VDAGRSVAECLLLAKAYLDESMKACFQSLLSQAEYLNVSVTQEVLLHLVVQGYLN
jgi:hypothetical protein